MIQAWSTIGEGHFGMDEPVNRAIEVSSLAVRREDVNVEVVANSSLVCVTILHSEEKMLSYKANCSSKNHSQVERLLGRACNFLPT